jgi:NADH-quinone oxidoreductase subunit E
METQCTCRKFETVCQVLDKYQRDPSKLIPVLQDVQKVYRYLPEEVLAFVATGLGLSPARVYGVASFYANFALEPKGKYVVHVCDGTACHVKGAGIIRDELYKTLGLSEKKSTTDDMLFTVETVSCLGACGLAPVLTVNGKVYGQATPDSAKAIINDIKTKEQQI